MARGFESKSVESQQQEPLSAPGREKKSREEIERDHKRRSLELDRRGVAHDLENTTSDVRRSSLQHALQHLDGELRKIDGE
jgi:hypothetical protein